MYTHSQAHIFSAQDTISIEYTHGLHTAQHFGAVQNIQSAHTHIYAHYWLCPGAKGTSGTMKYPVCAKESVINTLAWPNTVYT